MIVRLAVNAILSVALIVFVAAAADAARIGPEFDVAAGNFGKLPAVAVQQNGNIVAVWHEDNEIRGQRLSGNGRAIGGVFTVGPAVVATPAVSALSNGGFVVVWTGRGPDGSTGIFAQRFAADGRKLGRRIAVDSSPPVHQYAPSVTANGNGFVVVWTAVDLDGSSNRHGVFGQRFSRAGRKLGPEFEVKASPSMWDHEPAVASLNKGGFVVVWTGVVEGYPHVLGKVYTRKGRPLSEEFLVSTQEIGRGTAKPAVAGLNTGFVVVWEWVPIEGKGRGTVEIEGQRFNPRGGKIGQPFRVNSRSVGQQIVPKVAGLNKGTFAVVWQSGFEGHFSQSVKGQHFGKRGQKIGREFVVNKGTGGSHQAPTVAHSRVNRYVVLWESINAGIVGQRFRR